MLHALAVQRIVERSVNSQYPACADVEMHVPTWVSFRRELPTAAKLSRNAQLGCMLGTSSTSEPILVALLQDRAIVLKEKCAIEE